MKKKCASVIISVFLFMLSIPQASFAELASYLEKGSQPEISCAVSNALNLLDVSGKIVKRYYDGTKEFLFNAYALDNGSSHVPEYAANTDKIFIGISAMTVINGKKDIFQEKGICSYAKFLDYRMRGSPPGGTEITKLYLLYIEALQKGSVPASFIIDKNILI